MNDKNLMPYKAELESMLVSIPGVKAGKAFGYPAYKINGKVFAFIGEEGLALKLSENRVLEIIASDPSVRPFEVGEGIVWREWIFISRESAEAYHDDSALMEEAAAYVASKA